MMLSPNLPLSGVVLEIFWKRSTLPFWIGFFRGEFWFILFKFQKEGKGLFQGLYSLTVGEQFSKFVHYISCDISLDSSMTIISNYTLNARRQFSRFSRIITSLMWYIYGNPCDHLFTLCISCALFPLCPSLGEYRVPSGGLIVMGKLYNWC